MDKISGIIPSTSRVTSTDLSASPPVRPGTPTFGREVGVSTNNPSKKEKEAREMAIITNLSDGFFMNGKKDKTVSGRDTMGAAQAESAMQGAKRPEEMEDQLDQPEVGRYIDVQV